MLCAAPPVASIFLSLPPAKNAIHRLSGDQKIRPAPSVPTSFVATSESIGRANTEVDAASRPEYAIQRPFGEIDTDSATGMSGRLIRKRVSSAGCDPRR